MISLGPTPFTLEVVQNIAQWYLFRLTQFWDERGGGLDPQDVTGWSFMMIVKRDTDDADAFAVFEIPDGGGPPAPVGGDAPLPSDGQFYFVITPFQSDIAPGDYFGEIRGWDPTQAVGSDPPRVKLPFTYRVVQTLDLVYP